jgi:hypothetical protein
MAVMATLLGIDGFEAAFERIERIPDGDVDILVGMLVVLFMGNHYVVVGDLGFYANMVDLALLVVVMGSFEYDSETLDLVAESLQLFYSLVDYILYCLGMINTSENNLSITNHGMRLLYAIAQLTLREHLRPWTRYYSGAKACQCKFHLQLQESKNVHQSDI